MLKSYKKLDRWYGPLEPEGEGAAAGPAQPELSAEADDAGPARYPDYIAEAGSATAAPDPAPAELSGRRSEFTGGWSDWVDDPTGERDAELLRLSWPDADEPAEPVRIGRTSGRLRDAAADTGARRRRTFGVLVAVVAVLAIATAVVVYLLAPGAPRAAGPDDGAGLRFTSSSAGTPAAKCPDEQAGAVVRGAGSGGTDSGPAAILRFQYAYYVERSGAAARAVVAPGAPISAVEVIQAGIDSVEPGTGHCVRIVTVADGRYSVEVTEYRPDGEPATYNRQTVTTAVIGGRTLITGITAG